MRYITEMDLRDLYHEEPFTTYYLAADNRLTPGARQFLTDRRIPVKLHGKTNKEKTDTVPVDEETESVPSWQLLKLWHTLEHAESLILLTAEWFSRHGEHLAAEDFTALARTLQRTRMACEKENFRRPLPSGTVQKVNFMKKQITRSFRSAWKNYRKTRPCAPNF